MHTVNNYLHTDLPRSPQISRRYHKVYIVDVIHRTMSHSVAQIAVFSKSVAAFILSQSSGHYTELKFSL